MILHLFLGLVLIQVLTEACFITDCPHGMGKRSLSTAPRTKYPQCPTCGPSHLQKGPNAFRCFGPELCCSPTKGCLTGPAVRNCAYEDLNPAPCKNHAKECKTAGLGGQCVNPGVCCNPQGKCFGQNSVKTW